MQRRIVSFVLGLLFLGLSVTGCSASSTSSSSAIPEKVSTDIQ